MRSLRFEWISGIGLALAGFLFLTGLSEDRVVARVNGDRITLADLGYRLKHDFGDKRGEEFTNKAIETLIRNRVAIQEAKRQGIPQPTEADFRKAFSPGQMTLPNLADRAAQEDWVVRLMADGMAAKVMPKVPFKEVEVKKLFEELRSSLQPEMADIRWIVVQEKEQADRIYEQIQSGAEFAEMAKLHSIEKASGPDGGWVGTIRPDKIPPELAEAVFASTVKTGTLVPPVKVVNPIPFYGPGGYYIVQVAKMIREGETTLEAWRPLVESTLRKERAEKQVEATLMKRRKQAKVWIDKDLHALVAEAQPQSAAETNKK